MVNGSWLIDQAHGSGLMAHASMLVAQGQGKLALSHEPLTINNRLIKKSFDYISWVLCIVMAFVALICIFLLIGSMNLLINSLIG